VAKNSTFGARREELIFYLLEHSIKLRFLEKGCYFISARCRVGTVKSHFSDFRDIFNIVQFWDFRTFQQRNGGLLASVLATLIVHEIRSNGFHHIKGAVFKAGRSQRWPIFASYCTVGVDWG